MQHSRSLTLKFFNPAHDALNLGSESRPAKWWPWGGGGLHGLLATRPRGAAWGRARPAWAIGVVHLSTWIPQLGRSGGAGQ